MSTIYNLEPDGYLKELEDTIRQHFRYIPTSQGLSDEVFNEAEIIITRLGTHFNSEVINRFVKLKCICTPTTGLNHIDLVAAKEKGIAITSLRGETEFLRNVSATAELTWCLILNLVRNVSAAMTSVVNGDWDRDAFIGYELKGKTLGIIGYGRLGQIVGDYAKTFGMNTVAYDPDPELEENSTVKLVGLDVLLQTSDIVTLHASYDVNSGMILTSNLLSKLKPGAYFVNTARGELVDEEFLISLLNTDRLAGVALDVLASEYSGSNLQSMLSEPMHHAVTSGKNLIVTPHIGGVTHDSMRNTERFIVEKLISQYSNV
ncbi:MAG: NAD(P)-dependent oxidoreductase [Halodesulfovibrio sp.]|uniref:NAD(P)-dependent oxidoreductase n=1 Tax=Halodesulfovibrio sp. TaxID=1912772 RepID=UPI00359CEE4A